MSSVDVVVPCEGPHFLCSIKRSDQLLCCNFSSYTDNVDLPWISGDGAIELLTPPLKIVSDRYTVTIAVREKGFEQLVAGLIGTSFHLQHEIFEVGRIRRVSRARRMASRRCWANRVAARAPLMSL